METVWCSEDERVVIIKELESIGCCDLCILRYLGVKEPPIYRNSLEIQRILGRKNETNGKEEDEEANKRPKMSPCTACLGLLQTGIEEQSLQQIVGEIKKCNIEALSYSPALTVPISTQIRAYAIWFHLLKKFPSVYEPVKEYRPEGISMKSVWKWIATNYLQNALNQHAEWGMNGKLTVQIHLLYLDEENECLPLDKFLTQDGKIQLKKGRVAVTRQSVEAALSNMNCDKYFEMFQSPPSIPTNSMKILWVQCEHCPVFVAGRYCKYSRTLSQTPWVIDGVRKTENSVEELISVHVLKLLRADTAKFSSSGREDVDVRSLGRGRPFVFEVINPRRTAISREQMRQLQEDINKGTNLISVRDLQFVDKQDLGVLRDGEDSKTKSYCALCVAPSTIVTEQHCEILNKIPTPLILQQKTPVRVMHRRTVAVRERSILEIKAVPVLPDSNKVPADDQHHYKNLFVLHLTTQAGTYVKEFVHGDLGRTTPSVSDLLGFEADIIALDVEDVDVDWPPKIQDDEKNYYQAEQTVSGEMKNGNNS